MFVYEKRLQYPVNIKTTNPKLAKIIISQYGGPDGELGASLRYLSQRFTMPLPELKGTLTDIGTEDPHYNHLKLFNENKELGCCDFLKSYKLYCYTRKNSNIIRTVLKKDKHKTKVFDIRVYLI